ncbi:hypothetical protein [Cytobacillus massiliigabonensis]|uniref:hypothetical protein n=1 Tax=Cytobacillus massiliigabonensis TaxID=1871011 RepID=UPI000C84F87F|nr:hypothetical protein [Cytobacillus massiliigabonensis]
MKTETCVQSYSKNHTLIAGLHVIPGIWVNGSTYWMKQGKAELFLEEGISLHLKQDYDLHNAQLSSFEVINHRDHPKTVKVLFQHRTQYWDNNHVSFISPTENAVFHMADEQVHLVNGCIGKGEVRKTYTVQPLWNIYKNRIWDCLESGKIQYRPMAKGNVVSLLIYDYQFMGKGTFEGETWVINGNDEAELIHLNSSFLKKKIIN